MFENRLCDKIPRNFSDLIHIAARIVKKNPSKTVKAGPSWSSFIRLIRLEHVSACTSYTDNVTEASQVWS